MVKATDELPQKCVHGTYQNLWPSIFIHGFLAGGTGEKRRRNHIHFAPYDYNDKRVISGMRRDCDVAVYLDLRGAMSAGVSFYMSENQVILTPGIRGRLSPRFIAKAVNFKTGKVFFDKDISEKVEYLNLEVGTGATATTRCNVKDLVSRRRAISDVESNRQLRCDAVRSGQADECVMTAVIKNCRNGSSGET